MHICCAVTRVCPPVYVWMLTQSGMRLPGDSDTVQVGTVGGPGTASTASIGRCELLGGALAGIFLFAFVLEGNNVTLIIIAFGMSVNG